MPRSSLLIVPLAVVACHGEPAPAMGSMPARTEPAVAAGAEAPQPPNQPGAAGAQTIEGPPEGPYVIATQGPARSAAVAFARAPNALSLAEHLTASSGIVVDATSAYWTTFVASGTSSAPAVIRCTKTACNGRPSTFTSNGAFVGKLTLRAGNLYWVAGASSTFVMTCPVSGCPQGGPTQVVAATEQINNIAVDGANVYWTSGARTDAGAVYQCPLHGCSQPLVLASLGVRADAIAVDAHDVYWNTNETPKLHGALMRCAIGGSSGGPTTLASGFFAGNVAVDASHVYWIDLNGSAIRRCSKTDCGASQVTLASGAGHVQGIVLDGQNVYWSTPYGAPPRILKCAVDGCKRPTVIVESPRDISSFTVDATRVYWTDMEHPGPSEQLANIYSGPK